MIQVNLYWFRYFVELAISTKHPDTIPYQSLTEKQNFKVGGWSQLNSGEAVLVFSCRSLSGFLDVLGHFKYFHIFVRAVIAVRSYKWLCHTVSPLCSI